MTRLEFAVVLPAMKRATSKGRVEERRKSMVKMRMLDGFLRMKEELDVCKCESDV